MNVHVSTRTQQVPNRRDNSAVNTEIKALRSVLISTIASFDAKKAAINRLCELKRQGNSKASLILIKYSTDVMGNSKLQRIATSC